MSTADWGYLRLRRLDYNARELRAWCERIAAQPWREAFVFFKHEDEAKGPEFAQRFLAIASQGRQMDFSPKLRKGTKTRLGEAA